jgi:hypothetical protein
MNANQYRNGQTIRETALKDGKPHGVERVWHRNGVLAEETPFEDGQIHGLCRRWAEDGRLLGDFRMEHGSGLVRRWYANGQLATEIQTVGGAMSGRTRNWLRDGTLVAVTYYVDNAPVTREQYETAANGDPGLARYADAEVDPFDHRDTLDFEKMDHAQHVQELLNTARKEDALAWLNSGSARQIGDSADTSTLKELVGDILKAGAAQVVVARIYSDKAGKEFCDHLVVVLPDGTSPRGAIRRACTALVRRTGGVLFPINDIGENHLTLLSA